MLDDKLKVILDEAVYDSDYDSVPRMIAQIKQAFADSFIMTPKDSQLIEVNSYDRKAKYMTGQEWYERFWQAYETDLPKIADATIIREQVDKAAKKASGLKDE